MGAIPEVGFRSSVLKPLITSGLGISAGTLGGNQGIGFRLMHRKAELSELESECTWEYLMRRSQLMLGCPSKQTVEVVLRQMT